VRPKKYSCPACKQKTGVDILYGLPIYEAFKMAERKEIVLGGCCIDINNLERACTSCGHEWLIKRRKIKCEFVALVLPALESRHGARLSRSP
jgi:hypothetical protein